MPRHKCPLHLINDNRLHCPSLAGTKNLNNKRHLPPITLYIEVSGRETCFRFHYITFMDGRRSEELKTLLQPAMRFSLCVAPLCRPPSPLFIFIQTPHTGGLCCLSVVADYITFWHTHILPGPFWPKNMRGLWSDVCTRVCTWVINSNTNEVSLKKRYFEYFGGLFSLIIVNTLLLLREAKPILNSAPPPQKKSLYSLS